MSGNIEPPPDRHRCPGLCREEGFEVACVLGFVVCRDAEFVWCCGTVSFSGLCTMDMTKWNVEHSLFRDHRGRQENLFFVFWKGVNLNETFHFLTASVRHCRFLSQMCSSLVAVVTPDYVRYVFLSLSELSFWQLREVRCIVCLWWWKMTVGRKSCVAVRGCVHCVSKRSACVLFSCVWHYFCDVTGRVSFGLVQFVVKC